MNEIQYVDVSHVTVFLRMRVRILAEVIIPCVSYIEL